jgi:signal transduction histidine kinase
MVDQSYNIPLFDILTEDELEWIASHSTEILLQPGEYFTRQGERDARFGIVLDGELQITGIINGVQRVLGSNPRGSMSGEISLLHGSARTASAQAIKPTRLLVFDKTAFRDIFASVPVLGMRILRTAAERMSGNATVVTHDEKMAALGKFSAGMAHELNNPASAARRAAQVFSDLLPGLLSFSVKLCSLGLEHTQLERLLTMEGDFAARVQNTLPLSPLEQSDREDEMMDWLNQLGVGSSYDLASVFVSSGLKVEELQDALRDFPGAVRASVIEWLYCAINARSLLCEIDDSTTRISELVRAVKEYTYMDQGKIQEVDIHKSLENTLKVIAYKIKDVEVIREYDPDLPKIMANGSELNQVWTNLIDNAVDAVKGKPDGQIRLVTRCESDFVMVEVGDNGGGIPEEVLPRVFEPFFTTKDVGAGTGLGLDIVYRIITRHDGTIMTESQPGRTRFIVHLPVKGRSGAMVTEESD